MMELSATTPFQVHRPAGILGMDYVEFYVGNPNHAAHYYRTTFGLDSLGYAGLQTGVRDRSSYVVGNSSIRFVLTGALTAHGAIASFINTHGDAVCDLALRVGDVEAFYHDALSRGARGLKEPTVERVGDRQIKRATIHAFGDVVHSLIERDGDEWFMPGYSTQVVPALSSLCVSSLDHIAVTVPIGQLQQHVEFYRDVLGFDDTHQEYVSTENSGMNSRVMQSPDGSIRLPILEPVPGKKTSQIEEFLSFNMGPGVQHAALHSDDIIGTVSAVQNRGVEFLRTPGAYYEVLADRLRDVAEDAAMLRSLNILVDHDSWGYLMQIFTKPLQSRPTFFVEIIQRKGARGFGSGNIKALFEAVEREQQMRGNL